MKSSHASIIDIEPTGAYAHLESLQKLRYSAGPLVNRAIINASTNNSGHHRSRALSRGMEFEEVRLYQAGDDVRTIDWRVTARTQVTHTKRYQDEKEKPVITLVDQRHSLFFGSQSCFKSVYACYLAAIINWCTLKRNDKAGGMVIDTYNINETRPARSHKTVNQWLQQLHKSNQQLNAELNHAEPSFSASLKQLRRVATSGYECFIISDFYDLDAQCEQYLFDLSRKHRISLCWLVDPLEKMIPLLQDVTLSNGIDKTSLSITSLQQNEHEDSFLIKRQEMESLCKRLRINLHEIDISEALIKNAIPIVALR